MLKRPQNVIILTADEMRFDVLSKSGNPDCKTPHLDRFADKAIFFENAFAQCPKCVPSRVSMMTGRYPNSDGIRTINDENLISASTPNLLKSLKDVGYETAVFGINHVWKDLWSSNMPGESYVDFHSWTEGYDQVWKAKYPIPELTTSCAEAPYESKQDYQYGSRLLEQPKVNSHDNGRVEQAIQFLQNRPDRERPFYLQLNISQPHPTYEVEEPWFSMYERDSIKPFPRTLPKNAPLPLLAQRKYRVADAPDPDMLSEIQAVYYGMVTKVDSLLGKIFECIEAEGLMEDTVILFFSDHGDYASQYGLPEKFDTSLADCLLHVPCIMYAPNLPNRKKVAGLTELIDLTPTVLEILGMPALPHAHGRSLLPTIYGDEGRKAVFACGGHELEMRNRFNAGEPDIDFDVSQLGGKQKTYFYCPDSMARAKMVRTREWKLVIRECGGNELYNIISDPYELNNVYGLPEHFQIEKELLLQLVQWSLKTDTDQPYQDKVWA